MMSAPAISHNVASSEFRRAWIARARMAVTAAFGKSRMLNAGSTGPGSSKRINRNAGTAINTRRTRLSPPTLYEHDNASTHQDKSDDGGKRFHRGQGLVPVVPKLKHALTSIESARPALRKSQCVERTCLCEQKCNLPFVARQHDLCRTAWGAPAMLSRSSSGRPLPRPSRPGLAGGGILLAPTTIPSTRGLLSAVALSFNFGRPIGLLEWPAAILRGWPTPYKRRYN
jgi:hypothetical protein